MVLPGFTMVLHAKLLQTAAKQRWNQSKTMVKLIKTMVNPIKSMANLSKTQSKVNPDKFESWICWTSFHSSTLLLQTSSIFCIGMHKIDEIEYSWMRCICEYSVLFYLFVFFLNGKPMVCLTRAFGNETWKIFYLFLSC